MMRDTVNLYKFMLRIAVFSLFFFTISNASATACVTRDFIQKIAAGEVNAGMGHDNGNAVYVKFKNRDSWIPLSNHRNLNDSMGSSLLALLNTAMTMRLPVTVFDHHGNPCDDFDEIHIHRE